MKTPSSKAYYHLMCPYCQFPLYLNHSYKKRGTKLIYGTVICHCDEFPVLENIIYLQKFHNKQLVTLLNNGEYQRALITLLTADVSVIKKPLARLFFRFMLSKFKILNVSFLTWLFKNQYLHYFFNRHLEKDALLLFLPLAFIKRPQVWVDVGSGVPFLYAELLKLLPNLTLISVEKSFLYLFLTQHFFPTRQAISVCTDATVGPIYQLSVDVITLIDTLAFVSNQRQMLHTLKAYRRKSQTVIVGTGLGEHMYHSLSQQAYPISRKLVAKYLGESCLFFEDSLLVNDVSANRLTLETARINSYMHPTRYTVVCTSTKKAPASSLKLPSLAATRATFYWQPNEVTFTNQVY